MNCPVTGDDINFEMEHSVSDQLIDYIWDEEVIEESLVSNYRQELEVEVSSTDVTMDSTLSRSMDAADVTIIPLAGELQHIKTDHEDYLSGQIQLNEPGVALEHAYFKAEPAASEPTEISPIITNISSLKTPMLKVVDPSSLPVLPKVGFVNLGNLKVKLVKLTGGTVVSPSLTGMVNNEMLPAQIGAKDIKDEFKCSYCGKIFKTPRYRRVHVKNYHVNEHGEKITKKKVKCSLCEKEFASKISLNCHMNSIHSPLEINCNSCSYKTNRKCNLKRHILKMHIERQTSKDSKQFKCAYCNTECPTKKGLRCHEEESHNMWFVSRKVYRKCPLCSFRSSQFRKKEIFKHFKEKHSLNVTQQKLVFKSLAEFYSWKKTEEMNTKTSFYTANHTDTHILYFCHRRGYYKPSGKNKRHLKKTGSCKINGYCPSEIKVKLKNDGSVLVHYVPTHIGHENDFKYIRLSPEDRKFIASLISTKAPHREILKTVQSSLESSNIQRIHLINKKDLVNIQKSFNIKTETEKQPCDPMSVEAWDKDLKMSQEIALMEYNSEFIEEEQSEEDLKTKLQSLFEEIKEVAKSKPQLELVIQKMKEAKAEMQAIDSTDFLIEK